MTNNILGDKEKKESKKIKTPRCIIFKRIILVEKAWKLSHVYVKIKKMHHVQTTFSNEGFR